MGHIIFLDHMASYRYFIIFAYDGADFCGWQVQPRMRTVQGVLEQALSVILRSEVALTGAGRTDTGVHARYSVAHFDLEVSLALEQLLSLVEHLNRFLPRDIYVSDIVPVEADAHARFDALLRTYRYHVSLRKSPFTDRYATRLRGEYDFEAMNAAAAYLLGEHDFTSFSKKHTDVKTHICKVERARWIVLSPTRAYFEIAADRFLRNMVRATVGTLFAVGRHKLSPEEFRTILEARDRSLCASSAPPEGLFLHHITYPFTLPDIEE